jgi:hypothetical protein
MSAEEQGTNLLTIGITVILSIWTSAALEAVHGLITLFFGVTTCVTVFFVNRYLKKKYK